MALTEQVVFVDTNLGTHLAISVHRDITVRDFKREFEREHFKYFSESGEIHVSALRVERRSCLYSLSDSMSIKSVFQKMDETWFLHAEARVLSDCNGPCLQYCVASKVVDHVSEDNGVSHPSNPDHFVTTTAKGTTTKGNCKRWRGIRIRHQHPSLGKLQKFFYFTKKRKRRKIVSLPAKVDQTGSEINADDTAVPMHMDENNTCLNDCTSSEEHGPAEEDLPSISRRDGLTETSSEAVVSVSGIINKYFLNISEDGGDVSPTTSVTSRVHSSPKPHLKTKVGDSCTSRQVTAFASAKSSAKKLLPPPSPLPTEFGGRRFKHDKPEVGERLVMASYSLGISLSKKHPAIHLCSSGLNC